MADYTIEVAVPTVGPQGEVGPVGPPNTLTVGTVTTGAAGSSAEATVTGAAPNQTLNLTIPRGDTGATGAQGIQGPTGESGTTTIAQVEALMSRSYFRDFATHKNLNDHGTGPAITFTRASNATYFDANGVLQTAANDVPRFDHDPATGASRGLLIEEARTNSIRNSQAGGAAVGAPGTMPTNWSKSANVNNVVSEISEIGTENGLSYIDVKISGTPNASSTLFLFFESSTVVTAANAQTWVGSAYVKLASGATTGTTIRLVRRGLDASGVQVSGQDATTTFVPTSAALTTQRAVTPATAFSSASVERVNIFLRVEYTNGNQIGGSADGLTLRIAAPQLEQGAFPTSYIPTTNAAATRSADSAVVTPISSFYNQSEGTLFAEFSRTNVAKQTYFFGFSDPTTGGAEEMYIETAGGTPSTQRFQVRDGNVSQAAIGNYASATANTIYKMAARYAVDDFAVSQLGAAVSTDTSGTLPTVTRMEIATGQQSATHLRKIAYYPKRLSNALLQQLTT